MEHERNTAKDEQSLSSWKRTPTAERTRIAREICAKIENYYDRCRTFSHLMNGVLTPADVR
jgi:hypothetical protein